MYEVTNISCQFAVNLPACSGCFPFSISPSRSHLGVGFVCFSLFRCSPWLNNSSLSSHLALPLSSLLSYLTRILFGVTSAQPSFYNRPQ
ncbi:hypothetical protein EXN66_Car008215 [Channa argus]|uniref:Uncharacterized protein n=1 Tax=Channa argus TaxID=215402 RepID=A0A6G1PQN4_CHAAH|nr:hypothetical protein EXN66_Car008215 [Channa argus]